MSNPDDTVVFAAADACRSCGSEDRAEAHYVASPLAGIPVTCTDDWHDEDAREPGAQRPAAEDDHEPTLVSIPAVPAEDPAPRAASTAPSCGTCREVFAGDPEALGTTPLVAAALTAAIPAAGWQQDGETWTCTVCQAKAAAAPAPAPQPVTHETPPDSDPYRQYADMSAELDAEVAGFWEHENAEHNAARFRIRTRLHDARVRIEELAGSPA